MKILTAICEYNPLHLGHITHLNYIKQQLKPDFVAIIMSGNFTQRGEVAVKDKYTRASWAIQAGADIVFELPTVFATQNAEIFAKGATKLINALPGDKTLCFGTECDNKDVLIEIAKTTLYESDDYKNNLKKQLDNGIPFAKARLNAIKLTYPNFDFSPLLTPNNILGVEYIKSILQNGYDIKIETLKRSGNFLDEKINKNSPSALSIRKCILDGKKKLAKKSLPKFVYKDLPNEILDFSNEILYALNTLTKEEIKLLPDCSEGLENKIKALLKQSVTITELIERLKSKRYTMSRLKRIVMSALLGIDKNLINNCLESDLYFKVLAINKKSKDVLSVFSQSKYPILTRKTDISKLKGMQLNCFDKDVFASNIYSVSSKIKLNEFDMKIL